MREHRAEVAADASGRVLEIGAGTGLNTPHYGPGIEELVLAEPDPAMARKLRQAAGAAQAPTQVVEAPAEEIPFDDDSFDSVVSTMVLCTVADPDAAVAEIDRVLRPGGRLLFVEHVLSDSPRLARWQHRLAGAWAGFASGCRCNQDTLAMIDARLEIARVERSRWRGMPRLVHPLVAGEAIAAA
jgi:ubiquinone/menaquinone biosynthesis C-methylase UbiE